MYLQIIDKIKMHVTLDSNKRNQLLRQTNVSNPKEFRFLRGVVNNFYTVSLDRETMDRINPIILDHFFVIELTLRCFVEFHGLDPLLFLKAFRQLLENISDDLDVVLCGSKYSFRCFFPFLN